MKKTLFTLLSAMALVLGFSAPAMATGSDGPTPYSVTVDGIYLPSGETFQDNGHVNIKSNLGNKGIHFESLNNQPSGQWIGKDFLPWSAFGFDKDDICVTWVQLSQYNQHFGEGGQAPVGHGCETDIPDQPEDTKEKITLCHAKGPDAKNGWTVITVDKHAIFTKGHDNHDADIIPPFEYTTNGQEVKQYPGKNYRTMYNTVFEGSQVLQNGCVVPDRPKPPQPEPEVRESSETSIDCVEEIVLLTHYREERLPVWDEANWQWVMGDWSEPVVTHTPQRELTEAERAQCELPETGGQMTPILIAGGAGLGALALGTVMMVRRRETV